MSAKKLTQAVFEGLPPEYRWAAVDASGKAWAFIKKPVCDDLMFCDGDDAKSENVGVFFDASDWQNSLIERLDVPVVIGIDWAEKPEPEPQVDWSQAPEGATHYNTCSKRWFAVYGGGKVKVFNSGMWNIVQGYTVADLESATETIKRPESITEVARSIEAARIEEQACMPWPDGDPRYFETSDCYESLAVKVCADQPAAQVIDPPVLGNQSGRDAVNNPAHYTTGGIECIDAMQAMLSREEFIGYLRGNIFKYQWRYKHKNGVEDLRKADWYAQRLIRVEGEK